ncbi:MAG: winged helix-turn-helix transcriptional regulator [Spirulinaceae cyanobacterium SM2_1_0]|nr:winged helix-turn-helix transcriptional regulator [Spirulinaceae cyanobacterium SM2_1_0]
MIAPSQPATPDPAHADQCETRHPIDLEQVRALNVSVLTADKAQQMAELFAVLADPNRLRLLAVLAERELCVCDLAALVKLSESAVSHQLRTLRDRRLVRYRKQGRKVYYSLKDQHIFDVYRAVADHVDEPED